MLWENMEFDSIRSRHKNSSFLMIITSETFRYENENIFLYHNIILEDNCFVPILFLHSNTFLFYNEILYNVQAKLLKIQFFLILQKYYIYNIILIFFIIYIILYKFSMEIFFPILRQHFFIWSSRKSLSLVFI